MARHRENGSGPSFASSGIPLYYQLSTILRERIFDGTYAVGDRLPTEADLVASYGVSRITVRQALKSLEEDELIRREVGRGTFVAGHPRTPEPIGMDASRDELRLLERGTSVELLDLREVAANRQDARVLAVEVGAPVIHCARLRYLHDEPVSYTVNRFPKAVAERFEPEDWKKGSMMQAAEHRLGARLSVPEETVRATLADASIARLLRIRIGAPLLSVDRLIRTESGNVVTRVRTYYRSDVYSLNVHLARHAAERPRA